MTVSKAGSGQSDAVTLSLGSNATTVGAITANSIETFTVNSSRAAANSLTLGNITLDNGAGSQTITVTSASTVAANATFTADVVNFSGVTGNVTGPLVLANTAGASFTGGSGNTAVTGSANPDVINTGIGNDTIDGAAGNDIINAGDGTNSITGGAGVDTMTGGAGVDTYIFSGAAAASSSGGANGAAIADVITNFTRSTDKLQFTGAVDVVSAQQAAVQTAVTALAANSTDAQVATAMALANTTALGVSFAVFNGSTYVYFELNNTADYVAADDVFIKLVGVTTLPTFAADVIA
jgi:Ca2+-binding RTX toxin-like protein